MIEVDGRRTFIWCRVLEIPSIIWDMSKAFCELTERGKWLWTGTTVVLRF